MNAQVQNLLLSLGAMQLARKIPFDDPEVLLYARIGYAASQLLILGVYYYISSVIKKKNDTTVLKYVEPSNPMSPKEGGTLTTTTNRDYDLAETTKLVRSVYLGIAMMTFLHLYMKYTQPLFIQALMGIKNLVDAKPVAIHLRGKAAEGELKRPFKAGGMFGAASDPQTDKAAIDQAEKKAGKKEE
ncbi:inorganic phosphate transporter [Rickenella mellea]|uniref:Inorganic phosphate transporter n=1 Tax=Rickenella mellea TaxID=50990 RepID=A0A4Y7QFC3_9AGAM|nr:inorganic phosphate transporter [Rickenella mellea]